MKALLLALLLVPGMALRAGDRIVSGGEARVVVKLAEGSLVKLGENGSLRFAELNPSTELFRAALQLLEGAFRFTTDLTAKARKREVSVRVQQVTSFTVRVRHLPSREEARALAGRLKGRFGL